MLAVSLDDWEFKNSGSRDEPFFPVAVLRRLNKARGIEWSERLLQVACQISALTVEMTLSVMPFRGEGVGFGSMRLRACPPTVSRNQFRLLIPHTTKPGGIKTTVGD